MPAEYERCRDALIADGKSKKEAQRICAIRYFKKHGVTPQEAKSSNDSQFDSHEEELFDIISVLGNNNTNQ